MNKHWTEQEFKNPSAEFRGAPFWAWNNRLNKEQLVKQVGYFREMGMGGYHIHCRTGLDTEYLGEEFMDCVKSCEEEGKKQGLFTYLYDEDRWPSGAAGGIVTKEEKYRARYLCFVPDGMEEEGKLLQSYRITLENGYLKKYELVPTETAGETVWRLYLETAKPSPWFNNQTYLDTLNKDAVKRFAEVTYEAYARLLGEDFGKNVPSIFTDEPQFQRKTTLDFADEKKRIILPYTDRFSEFYQERYGENFLEHFPEVIWDLPEGEISVTRYQYHDGIAELFASSFADTLGFWCEAHGLMLTGHMMEEPTLLSQTSALGDCMRSYRSFQQPGIDMLCDWREYTTAKQAQSAAHQYGRQGVLSELYGVTNWDFDFRGHKLQGDWQAALGVTRRVHHLAWVSMEGEAKRDYPASIFYQSPWYKEYKMVEDHFARVNTVLMRGNPHVRIGVIHPVESYWLHFGPKEQTAKTRDVLEQNFKNVTEWLLFGLLDFDFLAESLLPEQQVHVENGKLCVGEMIYDAVLIPGNETLRGTTVDYLSEFAAEGGKVIFAGTEPAYVDAKKSSWVKELAERCVRVPFGKVDILDALEAYRELEIRRPDGSLAEEFLYQMREADSETWLFIANGKKAATQDVPRQEIYEIRLRGCYQAEVLDTQTGEVLSCAAVVRNGRTVIRKVLDLHDSLLLKLTPVTVPEETENVTEALVKTTGERKTVPEPEAFSLEEPNVLLLDQCEYRFDGGSWQEKEEILRIDSCLRERLGYAKRMEEWPQPWVTEEETGEKHQIELRFSFYSEQDFEDVMLALEGLEDSEITWNGEKVSKEPRGWFVDESIKKICLGWVRQGVNQLLVRRPFGKKTNLEWYYLLGRFGVRTAGRDAYLAAFPEKLCFGDYCSQGFPFYAGNLLYETEISVEEAGEYGIQISKFRAPLLKVSVDGDEWKPIAYAPYEVNTGYLEKGVHRLRIRSFGNRVNAFGAVHDCDETAVWFGPNEWRTEKERYSYEYQLKRMGVLKSPVIYKK